MNRYALIMLMLVLACLMVSAQEKTPPPAQSQEQPQNQAPAPAAAASTESDVVVIRIAGEPFTEKQVLSAIEALAGQTVFITPDQRKQQNTILFKGAIDNLTTTAVLKSEARRLNVTVDKAKIDQQMKTYSDRFPSKEEFLKAVASRGLTEDQVRKNVEDSLSMQDVIDQAVKDVPEPSDADIQKFYEDNPAKFAIPEQAHLAQIFLKTDPSSTPEQKAETKKKLEEIRADIVAKKITFADAASKFSQDTASASKGGDVGMLSKTGGQLKKIEDLVFATTQGDVTPIIEAQNGYRILHVVELTPAGVQSLEASKAAIKQYLDQTAKQKVVQKYVENLKSKAVVETFMTAEEFDRRHPVQ
jgi:peptidyl-prolyl cis-trans isomerase C